MIPTIIVSAIIVAILSAIIAVGIRNRKKGKSSCSCGGSCGSCGACHCNDGREA